jgi:hypothetical protein
MHRSTKQDAVHLFEAEVLKVGQALVHELDEVFLLVDRRLELQDRRPVTNTTDTEWTVPLPGEDSTTYRS